MAKISTKDRSNYSLSRKEVKRQEAIYELYCGENVLINDLCVLKEFYYEPLIPTGIFNSDELLTLFGGVTHLIEIHSSLRDELVDLRDQYGFTDIVAPTVLNWVSYSLLAFNTCVDHTGLHCPTRFLVRNIRWVILV